MPLRRFTPNGMYGSTRIDRIVITLLVTIVLGCEFVPSLCLPLSASVGCTFPSQPSNAQWGTCPSFLTVGSACTIICNPGFTLSATTTRCEAQEVFGEVQTCIASACDIPLPTRGTRGSCPMSLASGAAPCAIECEAGYAASPAGASTTCAYGVMTGQVCAPAACNTPPIYNGVAGTCASTIASGTSCQIQCNSGYTRSGDSMSCLLGSLTNTQTCQASPCTVTIPEGASYGTCGTTLASAGKCDIQCPSGTTRSSTSTTCSFGVLTPQQCSPSQCTVIEPANGSFGTCPSKLSNGGTCQLACQNGYTMTGASEASCIDGVFSGSPTCSPSSCTLPEVSNGNRGTCDTTMNSGTECQIECDAGYALVGSKTQCSLGSFTTVQSCQPVSCFMVEPLNGHLNTCSASLPSGSSCSFGCYNGYDLTGPSSMTCQLGYLTGPQQTCQPRPCQVPIPENGQRGTCGAEIQTFEECNIQCNPGYVVSGTGPTGCDRGSLPVQQKCIPASCTLTAPLNGGYGTCTPTIASGESCVMTCNAGYAATVNAGAVSSFTACSFGVLTSNQACAPTSCTLPTISSGTDGSCPTLIPSGTTCSRGCATGYSIVGTGTTCQLGVITASQACKEAACTVARPENGQMGTCASTIVHGASCQLACNEGYELSGESTTCSLGVATRQTCQPKSCAVPLTLGMTSGTCGSTLVSGGACVVECAAGFTRIGLSTKCTQGTLTSQSCQQSGCATAAPQNGYIINCPNPLTTGVPCQIGCNAGYFTNEPDISCVSGALDYLPTCTPSYCSAVAAPENGLYGTCGNYLDGFPSGAECSIICNEGYIPDRHATTCLNGITDEQVCVPNSCTVSAPSSGYLDASCQGGTLPNGTSCTAHCDTNYHLVGSERLVCHNTKIIGSQTCEPNRCTFPIPTNGNYGSFAAIIVNGTIASGYYSSYSIACNPGYTSTGSMSMCSSGTLIIPSCQPNSCTMIVPTHGQLGTCSSGTIVSGTTCNIGCDPYYHIVGEATKCEAGVLTQQVCQKTPCTMVQPINGGFGSCDTTLNWYESCSYSCRAGFLPSSNVTCLQGQLSSTPMCQPNICIVETPTNGGLGSCITEMHHLAMCGIVCNEGYQVKGSYTGCVYGSLSSIQTCEPKSCMMSKPLNGDFGTCASSLSPGTICQINCDTSNGYEVLGTSTQCQGGILTQQVCQPRSCQVPIPSNGERGGCGETLAHGDTCLIACNQGYGTGNSVVSCSAGVLTPSQLCQPDSCFTSAISNGGLGDCPPTLTHGSTCQMTCNSGYVITGPTTSCSKGVLTAQTCTGRPCTLTLPVGAWLGTCTAQLASGSTCAWGVESGYTSVSSNMCLGGQLLKTQTVIGQSCTMVQPENSLTGTCPTFGTLNHGEECNVECQIGFTKVGTHFKCQLGLMIDQQQCIKQDPPTPPIYSIMVETNIMNNTFYCGEEFTIAFRVTSVDLNGVEMNLTLSSTSNVIRIGSNHLTSLVINIPANTTIDGWTRLTQKLRTSDMCQSVASDVGDAVMITAMITTSRYYVSNPVLTFALKRRVTVIFTPSLTPTSMELGTSLTYTVSLVGQPSKAYAFVTLTYVNPPIVLIPDVVTSATFTVTAPMAMTKNGTIQIGWSLGFGVTREYLAPAPWIIHLTGQKELIVTPTSILSGTTKWWINTTHRLIFNSTNPPFDVKLIPQGCILSNMVLIFNNLTTLYHVDITTPLSLPPGTPALTSASIVMIYSSNYIVGPKFLNFTIVQPLLQPNGTNITFQMGLPTGIMIGTFGETQLLYELSTKLGIESSQITIVTSPSSSSGNSNITLVEVRINPSTNPLLPTPTMVFESLKFEIEAGTIQSTQFNILSNVTTIGLVIKTSSVTSSSSSTGSSSSSSYSSTGSSSNNAKLISTPSDAVSSISPPIIISKSIIDPCSLKPNFCLNRGTCVSTQVNSTSSDGLTQTVQLSCTCPKAFFGPHCQVAILACTNGCASPMGGNATIQLYGIGFQYITSLLLTGVELPFTIVSSLSSNDPLVSNEIRTISKGGPWEDNVLSGHTLVEVIQFRSLPYASLKGNGNLKTSAAIGGVGGEGGMEHMYTLTTFESLNFAVSDLTTPPSYQTLVVHGQFQVETNDSTLIGVTSDIIVPYTVTPIYYAVSTCVVGEFQNAIGDCIACPSSCACPGSGRCWPLPGYWSYSQSSIPIKCPLPESCPGTVTSAQVISSTFTTGDINSNALDTQVCAAGYTGVGCVQCAENYYQLNQRCYSCGTPSDQDGAMAAILIAGAAVTVGLSLAVALFEAPILVHVVAGFLFLQQFASTGGEGAKNINGEAGKNLATFFSFISVVNFELEILRPGCTVPSFTFLTLFWSTMGLIAFSAILFFMACVLRYILRRFAERRGRNLLSPTAQAELNARALEEAKKNLTEAAQMGSLFHTPAKTDFKRRLAHSFLILGSIFYLKASTLMIKMFQCVDASDPQSIYASTPGSESSYLLADLQTRCYEGTHLGSIIFVTIMFVVYTLGFPLYVFILLTRAFADKDTRGPIGWLYRRFAIFRPTQTKRQECKAAYKEMAKEEKHQQKLAGEVAANGGEGDNNAIHARAIETTQPNATLAKETDDDKYAVDKTNTTAIIDPALTLLYIEHRRMSLFGYLYLEIRQETFWYRMSYFVLNFYFACVTTFLTSSTNILQLFLLALCFSCEALIVCWYLPFVKWYHNTRQAMIALFSLGHAVIMIAIQTNAITQPMFWIGAIMFLMLCILLTMRNRILSLINRIFGSHAAMLNTKTGEIDTPNMDVDNNHGNQVMAIANAKYMVGALDTGSNGDDHQHHNDDDDTGSDQLDFSITGEGRSARERRLGREDDDEQESSEESSSQLDSTQETDGGFQRGPDTNRDSSSNPHVDDIISPPPRDVAIGVVAGDSSTAIRIHPEEDVPLHDSTPPHDHVEHHPNMIDDSMIDGKEGKRQCQSREASTSHDATSTVTTRRTSTSGVPLIDNGKSESHMRHSSTSIHGHKSNKSLTTSVELECASPSHQRRPSSGSFKSVHPAPPAPHTAAATVVSVNPHTGDSSSSVTPRTGTVSVVDRAAGWVSSSPRLTGQATPNDDSPMRISKRMPNMKLTPIVGLKHSTSVSVTPLSGSLESTPRLTQDTGTTTRHDDPPASSPSSSPSPVHVASPSGIPLSLVLPSSSIPVGERRATILRNLRQQSERFSLNDATVTVTVTPTTVTAPTTGSGPSITQ